MFQARVLLLEFGTLLIVWYFLLFFLLQGWRENKLTLFVCIFFH